MPTAWLKMSALLGVWWIWHPPTSRLVTPKAITRAPCLIAGALLLFGIHHTLGRAAISATTTTTTTLPSLLPPAPLCSDAKQGRALLLLLPLSLLRLSLSPPPTQLSRHLLWYPSPAINHHAVVPIPLPLRFCDFPHFSAPLSNAL